MNDTPQENPNKLFVGNLPYSVTEDELRDMFSPYGELVSVKVVVDRETGRSRGIAFVEFATAEAAQAAIKGSEGMEVENRPLRVNVARPRENSGGYGGGNHGGGGYRGGHNRGGGYNRGGGGQHNSGGGYNNGGGYNRD